MSIPKYRLTHWFGEPGDPPPPPAPPVPPPPPPPPADKLFTQAEVDRIVGYERRTLNKTLAETQAELEKVKAAGGNVQGLQQKVTELQNSLLSVEERKKQEEEQLKTTYETKLTAAEQRAKEATDRFNRTLIERELGKAALENLAYDETGGQIELVLGRQAKVVEAMDAQGRTTGVFRVMIASKTADGKDIDLEPKDAVAALRADRKYANLFKIDKTPGTGTLNSLGVIGDPNAPISTDTATYMAQRAELKKQGRI